MLLGYLAMGDGWHNNHHRAPSSARHGFAWYELDMPTSSSSFCSRWPGVGREATADVNHENPSENRQRLPVPDANPLLQ